MLYRLTPRSLCFLIAPILSLGILILDQVSKVWILNNIQNSILPITSFFNLVLTYNKGISFGLLNHGLTLPPVFFLTLTAVIVLGLFVWLYRQPHIWLAVAIGGIGGGALGNGMDRWRFGAVVDFLDFYIRHWHWPAFNLADSAIVCGVAIILADSLFAQRHKA